MNIHISDSCIRCGRCVKVCPSQIFRQEDVLTPVLVYNPQSCIGCGHCVAVCPANAVKHPDFPDERVHKIDFGAMPTPEQVELLCRVRRSNRALTKKSVPREWLDRIVEAAHRAPTASNMQQVEFTLVTDPAMLCQVSEFTIGVFEKIVRRLSSPFLRPWLSRLLPGVYDYIPVFASMKQDYAEGKDRILRGGTALLVIHTPKDNRFGAEDSNLAYQNASLMAESLGVSQIYMGFVLMAVRQDKNRTLNRLLGIEGRRIDAVMALGIPEFRYPNYIDRKPVVVTKI